MIAEMGFTITGERNAGYTQISNLFIRTYMPTANGNFVKVYLYLKMVCEHSEEKDLSVSKLADLMECTENDILRALRYWNREGLLEMQEEDGEISRILLRDTPGTDTAEAVSHETISDMAATGDTEPEIETNTEIEAGIESENPVETAEPDLPDKHTYTPLQAEALVKDIEIEKTITRVEALLGIPVSPAHLQLILYFMCDIGFSSELLVTLYETALKKGKKQPRYIEAIGISWAKQGIQTPEEAKQESESFSGTYSLVAKALGISRNLAPAEREIIDSWNTYHFADSIIKEACKRTVLQTGDTSLHYVSKILKDWHEKQVISLKDIEKCDESYQRQKRSVAGGKKIIPAQNQFQNFPQRSYSKNEYSSLEKQLLRAKES
ncbi:MAG: DnaD domain protein [Lachnospiraceae bacterium]|nr:DnaD domain protein [Lachnospiraceae bacterium]